ASNRRIDTDRNGVDTITQMDPLGRVRRGSKRDPGLAAIYGASEIPIEERLFDASGNVVQTTDANGNITRVVFDAAERRTSITESVGSPVQAATACAYDGVGNVLTVKDGRATGAPFDMRYVCDDRRRTTSEENGLGQITLYDYDQNDSVKTMTEPLAGS